MTAYVVLGGVLAFVVLALAIYRRTLAGQEDDLVHLKDNDAAELERQAEMARRIAVVDRWGIGLTVALAIYGLVLGGMMLLRTWEAGKTLGM